MTITLKHIKQHCGTVQKAKGHCSVQRSWALTESTQIWSV